MPGEVIEGEGMVGLGEALGLGATPPPAPPPLGPETAAEGLGLCRSRRAGPAGKEPARQLSVRLEGGSSCCWHQPANPSPFDPWAARGVRPRRPHLQSRALWEERPPTAPQSGALAGKGARHGVGVSGESPSQVAETRRVNECEQQGGPFQSFQGEQAGVPGAGEEAS